jgi:hypothetical protein
VWCMIATEWGQAADGLLWIEEVAMPLGLMEQREARARQDLESWTEVLEQAQAGPVNGVEMTRAVGREAEIKNEVEKIRHRAYVLEKRGWLVRAKDGRFMPAPGAVGRGASPASAERPRPGAWTA